MYYITLLTYYKGNKWHFIKTLTKLHIYSSIIFLVTDISDVFYYSSEPNSFQFKKFKSCNSYVLYKYLFKLHCDWSTRYNISLVGFKWCIKYWAYINKVLFGKAMDYFTFVNITISIYSKLVQWRKQFFKGRSVHDLIVWIW